VGMAAKIATKDKGILIRSSNWPRRSGGHSSPDSTRFSRWLPSSTARPLRKVLLRSLVLLLAAACVAASAPDRASPAQLQPIRAYIKDGWHNLMRSNSRLAQAAIDPKFPRSNGGRWPVYICSQEDVQRVGASLRAAMSPEDFASIELRKLPADHREVKEQGLLYLPHPYVVPGGRFNEM